LILLSSLSKKEAALNASYVVCVTSLNNPQMKKEQGALGPAVRGGQGSMGPCISYITEHKRQALLFESPLFFVPTREELQSYLILLSSLSKKEDFLVHLM
jgi:hypothetical protein